MDASTESQKKNHKFKVKDACLFIGDIRLTNHLLHQIPESRLIECNGDAVSLNGHVYGYTFFEKSERADIQFLWDNNGRLCQQRYVIISKASSALHAAKAFLSCVKGKKIDYMDGRDRDIKKLTKKELIRMVKQETHLKVVSNANHVINIARLDEEVRLKKEAMVHNIDSRLAEHIEQENSSMVANIIASATNIVKTSDIASDNADLFAQVVIDRLLEAAASEQASNAENERLFQESEQIFVLEH